MATSFSNEFNSSREANSNAVRCPSFLSIGVEKAGTSWLFEVLREHPEVFVPIAKDLKFFNQRYDKGLDWYFKFFQGAGNSKAIGELTNEYCLSPQYAQRIKRHLPDVKLIVCLREPVERLVSRYINTKTETMHRGTSFEDFAKLPEMLRESDYLANLKPFYEIFSADQILVSFFDDLNRNPAAFISRIYEFIGVTPDFMPPSLHRKVLAARESRIEWLGHVAYHTAQLLRSAGLANVIGAVKRNSHFERMMYRQTSSAPQIPEEVIQSLKACFTVDYDELSRLIGQPLPQSWREPFGAGDRSR